MGRLLFFSHILALHLLFKSAISVHEQAVPTPPLPILPLPSYSQLKWQQREIIMFLHFGVNTFTDREWGDGHECPQIFNPSGLNAGQWAAVAADAGVSLMILTAKHHDGFCLWPSKYTDHSVTRSPWDRHDSRYGHDIPYNEYYLAQLQELLNNYGEVREIWFDGAKDPRVQNGTYYFTEWFSMVKELQKSINIFSDAGPDVRWVGDEQGYASDTCWSLINRTSLSIGNPDTNYLNTGDPKGTDWVPAECDVSIRPGWFWHKSELPKSLTELLDIYYNSVGRNCLLLLNVPPNTTGLISDIDAQRLKQFHSAITTVFQKNIAEDCTVIVSSQRGGKQGGFGPENMIDSDHLWTYWAPEEEGGGGGRKEYWVEIRGKNNGSVRFNVVRVQEAIGLGQRIQGHEIYVDDELVIRGSTVGYKRLHRLEDGLVEARVVRIRITESRGLPLISSIGLHFDPFWHSKFTAGFKKR